MTLSIVRTGACAYMGIAAQIEAEREAALTYPAYVNYAGKNNERITRYEPDLQTVRVTYKQVRRSVLIRFTYPK